VVRIVVQGDITKRATTRQPPRLPLAVQTATCNARVLSFQSSYLVDASCFVLPSLYVADCASPWRVVLQNRRYRQKAQGPGVWQDRRCCKIAQGAGGSSQRGGFGKKKFIVKRVEVLLPVEGWQEECHSKRCGGGFLRKFAASASVLCDYLPRALHTRTDPTHNNPRHPR